MIKLELAFWIFINTVFSYHIIFSSSIHSRKIKTLIKIFFFFNESFTLSDKDH